MKPGSALRPAGTRAGIFVWRHGWAWPIAAAMGLAAAGLHVFVVLPDREALAAAQNELALQTRAARRSPPAAARQGESEKLAAFQDLLRRAPPADEAARTMAALAQASQIALAQGDYQQQKQPGSPWVQVQVSQPLRASYPQLRRYVESVLLALPTASLDQMAARRDSVSQSQLEVRLRWTLWSLPPMPAAVEANVPADKAP